MGLGAEPPADAHRVLVLDLHEAALLPIHRGGLRGTRQLQGVQAPPAVVVDEDTAPQPGVLILVLHAVLIFLVSVIVTCRRTKEEGGSNRNDHNTAAVPQTTTHASTATDETAIQRGAPSPANDCSHHSSQPSFTIAAAAVAVAIQ